HDNPDHAVRQALQEAHNAIMQAGQKQSSARKMGTTPVLAVQQADQGFVAGVGDSPAHLIRGDRVDQLTIDPPGAAPLPRNGTTPADKAKASPCRNVLSRFLGCAEMTEAAEVRPFPPQAGDRLVLASDGLAGHVSHEDLREGAVRFSDPQVWAEHLVE